MPASKKKRITTENVVSTSQPSSPGLPDQQEFHLYLHTLAQSAVRTVIEPVMREELDAFIAAAWGECSPKRKGYRNETAKASSTRRSLNAISAMNPTSPKGSHRCSWLESARRR